MNRRTLGQQLRAIVLATPFLGGLACCLDPATEFDAGGGDPGFDGGCPPPPVLDGGGFCPHTVARPLSFPDGGAYNGGPCPTCVAACRELLGSPELRLSSCAFDGGEVDCEVDDGCTGRRPAGLQLAPAAHGSILGRHLGRAAALEAASVLAFRSLARELRAHGAPRLLQDAARRAAADELRHTRATAVLAHRFGGQITGRRHGPRRIRPLAEVARENAVEGCVRETFGAVVGLWQARYASDRRVARAMRAIANDEVGHAELAWQVSDWVTPRLPRAQRRELQACRDEAFTALRQASVRPLHPALIAVAGLPTPPAAATILEQLSKLHP